MMGDFNAQIGANHLDTSCTCGKFGLGERNDRGQLFLDWLGDKYLLPTWTQPALHLVFTWTTGGQTKNQID